MKYLLIGLSMVLLSCSTSKKISQHYIFGKFIDDYGIAYEISNSLWEQYPGNQLEIVRHNPSESYLLTFNSTDSSFTRIDYMKFDDQEAYKWGYCYTGYDKESAKEAMNVKPANRKSPKIGCNGFPFSRMKELSNPKD